MTLYPIFLRMEGSLAIVVGGGAVGLRKCRGLLQAGARVRVVSPVYRPEFDELPVERVEREYREGDLEGARLVFAATNDRMVNHMVGEHAAALGIPANIADAPAECTFIVPARIETGDCQIAISTGGRDPKLAADTRARLEDALKLMKKN
jgi:precorrin-2 dehydrogenase / sirohydrochlorin ferrochelatase